MSKITLRVHGMSCEACVTSVTNALKAVAGVINVNVCLDNNQATVEYDELKTHVEALKIAVEDAGYDVG